MIAALASAGCEQWKAPKRIEDLEKRVGELTKQVEKIQGKKRRAARAATKASGNDRDDKGEGDGDGAKDGHGDEDGHGEKKDDEDGHGEKKDDEDGHGDKKGGAGHGEKKDDEDGHGEKKDDEDGHGEKKDEDGHGEKKDEDGHGEKKDEDGHGGKKDEDGHGEKKDEAKAEKSEKSEKSEKAAKAGKEEKPDKEASSDKDSAAMKNLLSVVEKNTKKGDAADKTVDREDKPHWSYEGKSGPPAWGALDAAWAKCSKGKAQSPIDIQPKGGAASPIAFHYNPTAASIVDNGHTLQVNLEPGSSIEIGDTLYKLEQFHVHTPSEHTIAGEHYPLEVHLVHKSASGKLAVVAVLYDVGVESKPLGTLWSTWPRKVGAPQPLRKPFDPSTLLPETRSLYRYPGSLTTPPCTEGVVWNVLRRTMTDSKQHLATVGVHYASNARPVQALNSRKIE